MFCDDDPEITASQCVIQKKRTLADADRPLFERRVTIFHYLAVVIVELDYFETCSFFLLRHNADYVLLNLFFDCCAIRSDLACLIQIFSCSLLTL